MNTIDEDRKVALVGIAWTNRLGQRRAGDGDSVAMTFDRPFKKGTRWLHEVVCAKRASGPWGVRAEISI
jgi:hypothetical protein